MADEQVVNLRGEGGVVWAFALPLSEVLLDQVKRGTLVPEDEESAALLRGDDASTPQAPPKVGAGSGRDVWAAYARALGIEVDEKMSRAEIIAATEVSANG